MNYFFKIQIQINVSLQKQTKKSKMLIQLIDILKYKYRVVVKEATPTML